MRSTLRFALHGGVAAVCLALALTGSVRMAHAQQPVEIDVAPPELVGGPWLNTAKGAPIKLASRKGNVTIVEFWTFG
jgi:hypothetical protein